MHKIHQTSFQAGVPLFAFRSFTANGRKFERGQDFPWQEMGISPEKVALLFRSKLVKHREPTAAPVVKAAPKPVPEAEARDYLDDIDDMKELRKLAAEAGAELRKSKVDQRRAIREALGE